MSNFFDFKAKTSSGEFDLKQLTGKVCLVVNVASKCGFTPQYKGLEELYQTFKDQGFEVLAFPCNQFGGQEPGSDSEIQEFCDLTYKTTFKIFSKVDVNGDNADPIFAYLKKEAPGLLGSEAVKWNFTKFLVGKDGEVIKRFAPNTEPSELTGDIQKALK